VRKPGANLLILGHGEDDVAIEIVAIRGQYQEAKDKSRASLSPRPLVNMAAVVGGRGGAILTTMRGEVQASTGRRTESG
jgi:hypothetical protein